MTLFVNNIKRIFRRKMNLLFLIVIPVVLISLISTIGSGSRMIRCGVTDYDDTEFTRGIIDKLKDESVITMIKEDEIQGKIFGQHLDVAIVIDKGFTQDIINNKDVKLKTMSLEETNTSISLKMSLESYLNAAVNIAQSANGDSDKFYKGMKIYNKGMFDTEYTHVKKKNENGDIKVSQMGFLVMSMLFLASLSSMIMIEDKEKKIYQRILTGPVKVSRYMVESILSFFTICIIQVVLIFIFMTQVLNVNFGPNIWGMIVVSAVFSLLSVALGVAINTVSNDMRQSGLIITLLITPMAMLGGCWWPIEFMPKVLRKIGRFVPTTYIMEAYSKLIYGTAISRVINEILVMLAFTIVFLLFASWKKTDLA